MNIPVGYLLNHPDGLSGERGLYYNYILGSNGIFIEAESPLIAARIPVAECEVRGLAPVESKIILTYGSIPQRFFDLALDVFLASPDKEHYVAVTGSAGYHFYVPVQDRNGGSVVYEVGEAVVLDLHSHGYMGAFFSGQDDRDEQGLKLYGVVGKLNTTPVVKLRVGVYGYFKTLAWRDIFDGSLTGAVEFEKEEVITQGDIHCNPDAHGPEL
jgi:PRTRC genetic system protein A